MASQSDLKALTPRHEFFIGIDSDGCAFDTMELKHKECFCPVFIDKFDCQAISKYARETWEFVNLYSKWRGCNRWLAVVHTLDLLAAREEVTRRGVKVHPARAVRQFIKINKTLSNATLKQAITAATDPADRKELERALEWSDTVNARIAEMVHDVPPFPFVRKSLEKARQQADMIVVSQTPTEALVREWEEHDIQGYVRLIAGQELGSKTEHIKYATERRYASNNILMIGDAPGDLKAARENNALFYPINPGAEDASWQRFYEESLDKFLLGKYAGDYEEVLIAEFDRLLPEKPHWER